MWLRVWVVEDTVDQKTMKVVDAGKEDTNDLYHRRYSSSPYSLRGIAHPSYPISYSIISVSSVSSL